MKYLLVTGIYPPDVGGPATIVSAAAFALKKQGKEVLVLTYGSTPSEPGVTRINAQQGKIKRYWDFYRQLRRSIQIGDVICATDVFSVGIPLRFALWGKANPLVLRLGGEWLWERAVEHSQTQQSLGEFWKKNQRSVFFRIAIWHYKALFKRAVSVILVSSMLARLWKNRFPLLVTKTKIVWGVSQEVRIDPISSRKEVGQLNALFIGRFVHVKNLPFLGEVISQASQRVGGLSITFIGDGPEVAALRKQLVDVPRVRFLGPLPHQEAMQHLERADLLVLPSFSDICPNVVIEALARGIPCLLTREHGLPLPLSGVIEQDPHDRLAWVETLVELTSNEVAYRRLRQSVKPVIFPQGPTLVQELTALESGL